jgi:hypothetical protein
MKIINNEHGRRLIVNTIDNNSEKQDLVINVKMKIAGLWAALMFLYLYADHFSLFRPGQMDEIISGKIGPFEVTQGSLFVFSVLMMIPAIMVFLSLILRPNWNRWTNVTLGLVYTAVNITNLIGETWVYYISFGIVEIALTLLIARYASLWRTQEVSLKTTALDQNEFGRNSSLSSTKGGLN